eukprot:TRINITY_DN18709_c0_g1_i1.p1 TRINITY_DN18709_c0_g1~~TRINITY_DN18709_c0_g1_i1.p1  ORF type:complete len:269 (-),score=67.95 TRINITY_DN18709_c0_g1_i1:57-773(-)
MSGAGDAAAKESAASAAAEVPEAQDDEVRPIRLPASAPGVGVPSAATSAGAEASTAAPSAPACYPQADANFTRELAGGGKYVGFWSSGAGASNTHTGSASNAASSTSCASGAHGNGGCASATSAAPAPDGGAVSDFETEDSRGARCCGLWRRKQRSNAAGSAAGSASGTWQPQVGDLVRTRKLQRASDNGLVGRITGLVPERGRYFVDVPADKGGASAAAPSRRLSVKAENLELAQAV